jgi:hypothetical protein
MKTLLLTKHFNYRYSIPIPVYTSTEPHIHPCINIQECINLRTLINAENNVLLLLLLLAQLSRCTDVFVLRSCNCCVSVCVIYQRLKSCLCGHYDRVQGCLLYLQQGIPWQAEVFKVLWALCHQLSSFLFADQRSRVYVLYGFWGFDLQVHRVCLSCYMYSVTMIPW